MSSYEIMIILKPILNEDERAVFGKDFEKQIKKLGGEITKTDNQGKKRLAYMIEKFDEGYYMVYYFNLEAGQIAELEKGLKFNDSTLRYLISKK